MHVRQNTYVASQTLQRSLVAAFAAFKDRAVGDPGLQARFQQRYVAACNTAFEAVREKRLVAASEALEKQLTDLATKLHSVGQVCEEHNVCLGLPFVRLSCCPRGLAGAS